MSEHYSNLNTLFKYLNAIWRRKNVEQNYLFRQIPPLQILNITQLNPNPITIQTYLKPNKKAKSKKFSLISEIRSSQEIIPLNYISGFSIKKEGKVKLFQTNKTDISTLSQFRSHPKLNQRRNLEQRVQKHIELVKKLFDESKIDIPKNFMLNFHFKNLDYKSHFELVKILLNS